MVGHYIYVIYFEWRITIIILLPSVGWKELGEKRCARKKKLLENRKDGGVGSGEWWVVVAESTEVAEEVQRKQMSPSLQLQSAKIFNLIQTE